MYKVKSLKEIINNWNDLAGFAIIPVLSSAEAKQKIPNK